MSDSAQLRYVGGDHVINQDGATMALLVGGPLQRAQLGALIEAAPKLFAALQDVEWGANEDHPEGGYFAACPWCGGGSPHDQNTPLEYAGHYTDCGLEEALAAARLAGERITIENASTGGS